MLALLGCGGITAAAAVADQYVTNTNDSGAGSLSEAISTVDADGNVVFMPAVAGQTIANDSLSLTKSMYFVNSSGGVVTMSLGYLGLSVDAGATFGLAEGLVISANDSTSSGIFGIRGSSPLALDNLDGTVSATAGLAGNAYAVYAGAGDLTISGGASGTISASTLSENAYGVYAAGGDITISNGFAGTLTVVGGDSCAGIYTTSGDILIEDGCGGSITGTGAAGFAYGIRTNSGRITIDSDLATSIDLGAANAAVGLYAAGQVVVNGDVSGTITCRSTGDASYACGIAGSSLHIQGISGTIAAECANSYAYGLYSSGAINGGDANTALVITGAVTANGDAAYAIRGNGMNLKVDNGGTVSAVGASGTACAIYGAGSTANQVELAAGCNITGDISLGSSTEDVLTLSGDAGSTTLAGNIYATESIYVTGGNWNITGNIYDAAAVNVSGGALALNGSMAGTLTVDENGVLSGNGTVGNLLNRGTVAPGNSIGAITVTGDYTNAAGSTLEIEINDAGQCDQIAVGGTATINGGTVEVQAAGGDYTAGTRYTFLTADSVTGTFDAITDDLAFLTATLVYGDDYVQLLLTRAGHYIDVAQTFNQRDVAGYLDDHYDSATGDLRTVLDEIDVMSANDARNTFNALSGEIYGSLSTVGLENSERFLRLVAQRVRAQSMTQSLDFAGAPSDLAQSLVYVNQSTCSAASSSGWTPWLESYGVGAALASDGNASGLSYATGGAAVGLERRLDAITVLGIVGGYTSSYVALDERADHGAIDSGQFGVYVHRALDTHYLTGMAAYSYNSYDTARQIALSDQTRTATANYGGNNFAFYCEAGKNITGRYVHLQPYGALEYIQLHQDHFLESGADAVDLSVGGVQADAFRSLLGARVLGCFRANRGRLTTLEARAVWRHEFLDENRIVDAMFAGQAGGTFAIAGANVDRDAAILGSGLTCRLCSGLTLYANYDLLLSANYAAHAGTGGVQYAW